MTKPHPGRRHRNIVRIWDDLYRIYIRQGDVRSIEEKTARPDLITGDKKMDEALRNHWQTSWVTINDMVEYYREGVEIQLSSDNDAVKIMDALLDHTSHWRMVIETMLNGPKAPVQDLLDMEAYAQIIYEIAKFAIHRESNQHAMIRRLNAHGFKNGILKGRRLTATVYGSSGPRVRSTESIESVEDKHYEPNVSAFRQAMMEDRELDNGPGRY